MSNYATKALKDNGFSNQGNIALGVAYLFYAITSLFSKTIVNKLKWKTSMIIGSIFYGLWIVMFLLPE